ncbi:helix-turn-helix transcriptional regulator (plasmid) [Tistrella mobilis]|uniref:helix-turn-helix domain-containing protein n=1 Tax=Tistrella mobilis TaxID=171437 RepID=UPI003558F12D
MRITEGDQTAVSFGMRLKAERTRIGLNQKEMAARLGVSLNTYGRYERGLRSPELRPLERLASMGIDVHWLLTGARVEHQRAPAEVDPQLMGMIVDAVRAMYRAEGAAIPDRTLGEEASRIYTELSPRQGDPAAALIALGEILAERRRRLRESATNPSRSKRPA